MNNSACPEVLEEVAALPAALLARLADARDDREYSQFAAELSPEILRHLPNCEFCREEIALLAGATATLTALPAPALPPDFAARISRVIAEIPQDAIVAPPSATSETAREYSQIFAESTPELAANDAPAMIAPPLPRAEKRGWRARFGLEKIGGAPRRNLKVAWASGSVLAAFVLVLATQIEPPSMMALRNQSAVSDSTVGDSVLRESAPAPASTRKETVAKSGAQKSATQPALGAPSKSNVTPKEIEKPRSDNAAADILQAPKIAQVPSRDIAPPLNKSDDIFTPRESSASPSLPLSTQRAASQPKSGVAKPRENSAVAKTRAPQFAPPRKPQDAARQNSSASNGASRDNNVKRDIAPRVLAAPIPQSASTARVTKGDDASEQRTSSLENRTVTQPDFPTPRATEPRTRTSARRENLTPPAAISSNEQNSDSAAPPNAASTRDMARSTQKMRDDSTAESRDAAPDASADSASSAAPKTNGRSGAFAAPAPIVRKRIAQPPISLHIELAAPRDIERARLRLELPRGAKLQNETPENIVWSGTLKRGENAVADVKIIAEETVASLRARAILETRERDSWSIIATKNIEWKTP